MARLIESAMPHSHHHPSALLEETAEPGLVMTLLGTAETWLDGQRLLLNRRQTEVLALLALHPEGLSLEQLHALVYGDQAVTFSTLKAEVSHLRARRRRPARLPPLPPADAGATDVEHVLGLLRRGEVGAAVEAYGGDLLPGTNSPALAEMAEYVAVAVREALLADPAARRRACATASSRRTTPRCSRSAWPRSTDRRPRHPAVPLLKGRLAVARR